MIMPNPEMLVPIVVLIGAPCKADEYDPTYEYCSDYHHGYSDRRKNSECHFDSPYRIGYESIRTRISIIIFRILIDLGRPDGFTLERLLV
jgi:hypothetical protein